LALNISERTNNTLANNNAVLDKLEKFVRGRSIDLEKLSELVSELKNIQLSNVKPTRDWNWDPTKMSTALKLEGNLVTKQAGEGTYNTVLGDKILRQGKHYWSIEIAGLNAENVWITAGIVDKENVSKWRESNWGEGSSTPFNEIIGISSFMQQYGGSGEIGKKKNFAVKNGQIWDFFLDLKKDIFRVSCEGEILLEILEGIKGRKFFPACILTMPSNLVILLDS